MSTQVNRLISLDAMRGFTIAAMILVNFPGNGDHVFATLMHSSWNGLTITDVIAPFFLLIYCWRFDCTGLYQAIGKEYAKR